MSGRPTTATPAVMARVDEYINGGWELDEAIPTVEGLALMLGVSRQSIYDWAEQNKEFSYTLDKLQGLQARILQTKGLTNSFNANITKLILSAKHNFAEKTETDITSKGASIVEPNPEKALAYAEYVKNRES